jgi:hypothetical protein
MFTFEGEMCELCERTMSNDRVVHLIDDRIYCRTCGPRVHLAKRAELNIGCGCFKYDRNLGDYIPSDECLGEC